MKPPPAHALVNRLIALTLLLLVFSGSLGLGAVWARQEISQVANRSRSLELQIAEVERRLDQVNTEVATAVGPKALLQQNQEMRLALASPDEAQVRRVSESPELRLVTRLNRDRFSRAANAGDSALTFQVVTASLR